MIPTAVLNVTGTTFSSNVPVAIDGDTIIISGGGNVYVYVKPASGWADMSPTATLTASDELSGDGFGTAIAISGDIIVVTSPYENSDTGAAYVFVKPAAGWANMTETAKLTASDGMADDAFGGSAAVSGNTVAIGATRYLSTGRAYVFVEPSGGWSDTTQKAELTPSDAITGSDFGFCISASGGGILVGLSPYGVFGQGTPEAYMFVKPAGGWVNMGQTARLTPADPFPWDQFGSAVVLRGSTAVVGAQNRSPTSSYGSGGAYVFTEPANGWHDMSSHVVLTGSDAHHRANFGAALAMSGNMLVIGAPNASFHAAYVFGLP